MPPASYAVPDPPAPRRADAAFMLSHPAHFVALGFGAGLSPVAPGTCGTLWAWIVFLVLQQWLDAGQMGELVALSLPLGWWACSVTARNLRSPDPSSIVWDEIACFWIVLWFVMPAGWEAQLSAFLVFRFFDMAKPGPMGWADRRFKCTGWRGGFGIMIDDIVAAFCTLFVLALWRALW
jgi:phosphatidylglycerophosphatase A